MSLKKDYSLQIPLRCMTCGANYAFETDEKTGYVICLARKWWLICDKQKEKKDAG